MPKKTVGFLALVAAILGCAMPAHGATCAEKFYLENGACTPCNTYRPDPEYCPGDDRRYLCPTTDTDYNALTGYTFIYGYEASYSHGTFPEYCYSGMHFRDPYGNETLIECPWNGQNYLCDRRLWYIAGTGWYLADFDFKSSYNWYSAVKPCTNAPSHAHYIGPGTPDAPDGSVTDANDCPWACDDGYGRVGETCKPLCTAGVTKIHVGAAVAPLFPVKYTTPSLVVRTAGGLCYGNLTPGNGPGINIRIGDTTYHLS